MMKFFSLIRACLTDNMQIFNVNTRNNKKIFKILIPIILSLVCMISIGSYAYMFIIPLRNFNAEYILLSVFVIASFFLTLIEGIYKASGLLFNCRDDDLLLSLPIKRSMVLSIRIFKFYLFELIYNSLFMLPAIVVYIYYVKVSFSFYIVSLFVLLLLPIIPIIISCIIGSIILRISSKFRFKNLVQIVATVIFLIMILFFSFNMKGLINSLEANAISINSVITKIYYPCYAYVKMATNFEIIDLLLFIVINISIFVITILYLSYIYFKVNSNSKIVKTGNYKRIYTIRKNNPIISLIKKEFRRFICSPVFIINSCFGLVLFIIGIITATINFDKVASSIAMESSISIETIRDYIPIILYCFICFTSFMTSITSSMISLEGKSFTLLKSLPIKSTIIILSKILMAILVIIPFIVLGDIIIFIKFSFNIWEMLLVLVGTILLPFISETIGIIINLKYPKMDTENDTEVVKQSISSMIAVFLGMALSFISVFGFIYSIKKGISIILILAISDIIFGIIFIILLIYIKRNCIRLFNSINV